MYHIKIQFYDELNDFLKKEMRNGETACTFKGRRSVKDLIESLGVPHVEVDCILANSVPVPLTHILSDLEEIRVYPDHSTAGLDLKEGLRPSCGPEPRFVLDVHLAKLAKKLRLLGFDTVHDNFSGDRTLASISDREDRVLLTRDRQLLMHRIVKCGLYVRNIYPDRQIHEVLERMSLWESCRPFTRCIDCNGDIYPFDFEEKGTELPADIPEGVKSWCREYRRCSSCKKFFWKGSHYERLSSYVKKIMAGKIRDDR